MVPGRTQIKGEGPRLYNLFVAQAAHISYFHTDTIFARYLTNHLTGLFLWWQTCRDSLFCWYLYSKRPTPSQNVEQVIYVSWRTLAQHRLLHCSFRGVWYIHRVVQGCVYNMLNAWLQRMIPRQKGASCMRSMKTAHHVVHCLLRMAQTFGWWNLRRYLALRWDMGNDLVSA